MEFIFIIGIIVVIAFVANLFLHGKCEHCGKSVRGGDMYGDPIKGYYCKDCRFEKDRK